METNAIRKPKPSKPNRAPPFNDKATASPRKVKRSPVTQVQKLKHRITQMLTQLRPLHSTSVTIDHNHNGIHNVLLAGNLIGSFELCPVWGLENALYRRAIDMGLDPADECYLCNGQIFITQAQASAQLVAEHLCATAVWTMPDYD
jgi:hypothetical protein